jgi:EmrB/QacA subfamily drug resistance transporter
MPPRTTNRWLVLVLVCFAQFMVILDATVVNVALPSIQKDLGLSEANLQWIVNAYALAFGGFLLLGGRAGDLLGRKRLFLFGLVVFTVASLLNALAVDSAMLIACRGLQGLGAAFISPAALAIISTTFEEGADRAKALGVWAAIAVGGSAVGLIVGGALTQLLSWPWIFFINIPIGIAVFAFSLFYLPESKDEAAHRSFDVAGAVAVTAGLMSLVYAIVQGPEKGWTSAQTIGTLVLSAVLLVSFVLIEQRSKAPLVRLSIFRVRSLLTANATMFLVGAGLFAMFFFNSLYLQRVLGYGPLKAGLAFLPFTFGIIISAGLASRFAPRIGVRPVAIVGMVVTIAGMLYLTHIQANGTYAVDLLPALLLTSLGMGAVFLPLTLIATTGLDDDDQGLASGLFNTSQQIGGALGLAILTSLAASKTSSVHGVSQSEALVQGFHVAFLGGAVFIIAALVVFMALLRKRHVARIEAEAQPAPAAS